MLPNRKDREKKAKKKHYYSHREKILEKQRAYDRDPVNRERANARKRARYAENAEEERRLARERRANWTPERKAHERAMAAKRYAEKKKKKVVVELVDPGVKAMLERERLRNKKEFLFLLRGVSEE